MQATPMARMGLVPRPRVGLVKAINATLGENNELIPAEAGASTCLLYLHYSNRDAAAIDVSFRWGSGSVFFPTYMLQGSAVVVNLIGAELVGPVNTALNVLLSAVGDVLVTAVYLQFAETSGA